MDVSKKSFAFITMCAVVVVADAGLNTTGSKNYSISQKCHFSFFKTCRFRQKFRQKYGILPFLPTQYIDFYCNIFT